MMQLFSNASTTNTNAAFTDPNFKPIPLTNLGSYTSNDEDAQLTKDFEHLWRFVEKVVGAEKVSSTIDCLLEIALLKQLEYDWDGYGGYPIFERVLNTAVVSVLVIHQSLDLSALETFSAVPGADGSMQLEWHERGYDIEYWILPDGKIDIDVHCLRTQSDEAAEEDLEFHDAINMLTYWLSKMLEADDYLCKD